MADQEPATIEPDPARDRAGTPLATPIATPLATPIVCDGAWNAGDAEASAGLHPLLAAALPRAPAGRVVLRGLPFALGSPAERRWLVALHEPSRISVPAGTRAGYLVIASFADLERDADGRRPPGRPVGWTDAVGEPLAAIRLIGDTGEVQDIVLRRRFETTDGIVGWGQLPFRAVHHRAEQPIDPAGPLPARGVGRIAPPGHPGPISILPGAWGGAQTGVEDFVPSPRDDLVLWLHAAAIPARLGDLASLELRALATAPGTSVVVAGMTAFRGTASPLRWGPRRTVRVTGPGRFVGVDLGLVARVTPAPPVMDASADEPAPVASSSAGVPAAAPHGADPPDCAAAPGAARPAIRGWGEGSVSPMAAPPAVDVELVAAADARLLVDGAALPIAGIPAAGRAGESATIVALPDAVIPLRLDLVDHLGQPVAGRVAIRASDGRRLPPDGHADRVNPALYEDHGADLLLGDEVYAYVEPRVGVHVPAGEIEVVAVRGFTVPPIVRRITVDGTRPGRPVELRFAPPVADLHGWMSSDSHVHFLAPSTALLQAQAEDVALVWLLAAQWADLVTGLTDQPAGPLATADGRHVVALGSENRQNLLGHVALLGAHRSVLPFATGGPPEGRIGQPLETTLAEWAARARQDGGMAIGAHFPLPYAEVVADIALGALDALEMQAFAPGLDSPPVTEWYRFLSAGFRLPIVGGTDKMSAGVPLGQVRTLARVDGEPSIEAWMAAVRSGRTVVSSGPVLTLEADGVEPGGTLERPAGTRVQVRAAAVAAQPVLTALELVQDGVVVATAANPAGVDRLALDAPVRLDRSGWLAARCRGVGTIRSAFATAMAAHTSAIAFEVPGRPRPPADLRSPLAIIEGVRSWLGELATVRSARDIEPALDLLDRAERELRRRSA
jgi:hypothetical protein